MMRRFVVLKDFSIKGVEFKTDETCFVEKFGILCVIDNRVGVSGYMFAVLESHGYIKLF